MDISEYTPFVLPEFDILNLYGRSNNRMLELLLAGSFVGIFEVVKLDSVV